MMLLFMELFGLHRNLLKNISFHFISDSWNNPHYPHKAVPQFIPQPPPPPVFGGNSLIYALYQHFGQIHNKMLQFLFRSSNSYS